ncbi:MAG: leucyl aminopeptidase family protein [Mycoplasmatales bacterium]|nr:leucyl aminopeptidase family protein [Mycoplasmatales bacterium]
MIKQWNKNKKDFVLKAFFDSKKINKDIIKKNNSITEMVSEKEAYIYLGKESEYNKESLMKTIQVLIGLQRTYLLDVESFLNKNLEEKHFVSRLVEAYVLKNGEVYSLKSKKPENKLNLVLLNLSKEGKEAFKMSEREAEAMNFAKSFQMMPNNVLNSVNYANELKKIFSKMENISVKVLTLPEIKKLKMGLLLGVNKGSEHDARVVILEYKGNPKSKEKTVAVGKGIMFDSGGYSLKPSNYMGGMKFDMSATAILAGAMKLISHNKPKTNFSVVLPMTDNMIGTKAQTVDSVQTSMNGKTVEINNADAEGRLILADGITYAIRNLKATKIIDMATLTGAILVSLGATYTGIWTTDDKDWEVVKKAAENKNELVWRMPFHEDFVEYMKKSPIADIRNAKNNSYGGASAAAMFLKEFTEGVPYIHMDIAGTAEQNGFAKGVLVKTIAEIANG